ncbi:MAG: TonB-dependent receptor [Bacteroidia bacterium]|nr:TonB-dependent receptor [Bacteroidia bacterium]
MSIAGNTQDTAARSPLRYAVIMAVKLKDSSLVAYTRSDSGGFFKLAAIPVDTYQVVISHPLFGDQYYYLFGSNTNNTFDFGRIILPPKSHSLNEVVIYAFKDPIYYKGDTLIYTADSFKVKPNATVEDLLKRLPGIQVDGQGKITAQGKQVDKVLVDGDEFFGSDPTTATKNLNANTIESVQVYEKKNDVSSDNAVDDVQKIINLKLKEDAKKGYFGKMSAATDFTTFHEGELLANKFTNKQKVSVFALGSNTPRSTLGWGDMYKYGLNDEMNMQQNEDGSTFYYNNSNNRNGVPQTLKTGLYYADKLSKRAKLSLNYSYTNTQLKSRTQTRSQYFLTDSSYSTTNQSENLQQTQSHGLNGTLNYTLDSLTDLEIKPRLKVSLDNTSSNSVTDFMSNVGELTRKTNVYNTNDGKLYDINTNGRLKRNFKKRERLLVLTYNYTFSNSESNGILKSDNTSFVSAIAANDSINQQKKSENGNQSHSASLVYTEPITKKIKLEFSYDYFLTTGNQDKRALKFYNGDYSLKDSLFTNNFRNIRNTNRVGLKFIYEVKKQRFATGLRVRQVYISNDNLAANQKVTQLVNNVLPYLTHMYKFSDNARLNFQYFTDSRQPSINQLQPVPDNSNPNQIRLGNPNLLPTFINKFNASFNSYRMVSGKGIWASIDVVTTNNDFSNSIVYDNLGRTITQVVNVNGNYNANAHIYINLPLFKKVIELSPHVNGSVSSRANYINGQKNITKETSSGGGLDITLKLEEYTFAIGGNCDFNDPVSTLNLKSSLPYSSQSYNAYFSIQFAKRFVVESDVVYHINSRRTAGYNINYLLWNASLGRNFLKNENFIVSVVAMDILNQNINTDRNVWDNVVTDTKTNVIGRYIMLKAVFKFNSAKTKEENEYF